jgi:ribosomal protein S18 acetylase RimI-like enzyme
MLEIRPLTPADAPAIAEIAESVRFRPDTANPAQGYLVYIGSPEDYRQRLLGNQSSFGAWHEDHLIAFLLTSPASGNTATKAADPVIYKYFFDQNAWLIDQIAVRPASRGLGAAPALLRHFFDVVRPPRATASIMHAPYRNLRSIGFFQDRFGFTNIAEYTEGDGFHWGIYEWLPTAKM